MNALDEYTNTFFSNAFAEYFSYDKMGNILSLDRYDKEGELMDELAYILFGASVAKGGR